MTIERVFVAGAGLMGHGIAQVHAAIGLPVTLYEPDLARAEAGRDKIAANLERAVAKGRLTREERDATLARLEPTADLGRVATADLVIEAVFEDLAVKSALWRELDASSPPAAIFDSNTWSMAILSLAVAVAGDRG
jgi:3-hydroxybutyryl-CoA dehydrogenase